MWLIKFFLTFPIFEYNLKSMKLPKGRAILDNARLEFINFENILHAGKRERAHKVLGYISIIYPETVELIFLKQGEPFNAARIGRHNREIVPIKDVVEKAKKATTGIISYYATDPILLAMIISSIASKPVKENVDSSKIQPKILVEKLKQSKFNGFLWIRHNLDESFIKFEEGSFAACYFSGASEKEEDENAIWSYLNNSDIKISVFDKIEAAVASQATPSQVEMFLKVFTELHKNFGKTLGVALVLRTSMIARETTKKEFPFLDNFKIGSDLSVTGDVVIDPEALVKGFARWFDLIFESFSTFLGKEATNIIQDALKDYRFALKASKFFNYTKWKIE